MAEKVLLVCTSTASNVRKAIGVLKGVLYRSPQIDLLCKSSELAEYEKEEPLQNIWVFPKRQEYRAALKLWRRIRKESYDVVAVLWCQDTERAKAKCFALLCGGKRLLIFNENLDCEYLKTSYLKAIILARTWEGRRLPQSWSQRIRKPVYTGYWASMRLLFLPVRFVILLIASGSLFYSKLIHKDTGS
jgi:hypothetical protein